MNTLGSLKVAKHMDKWMLGTESKEKSESCYVSNVETSDR